MVIEGGFEGLGARTEGLLRTILYTGRRVAGYGVYLEVGHLLDERYRLERVIGEGGMGVVFAARHVELNELVAVKVLHSSSAIDEEHLERFLREARLAAKIKNEHVVRVLDVARGRGATPPYIAMEYLEGVDLAELLASRGPLPATEAVDYVLQACEAVMEAHQLGIVHRDLKPSNLLLARRSDGAPLIKVLDFGISKAHEEDSKLTTTRAVFGSPAYMSPEQIRSAKHVDQRSDVWALAVVLFEILTGRLPFVGETATSILAAVAADPPLSLAHYADVPDGLQEAIERCLVKDRDRRVGSILEMASVLAPFASPAGHASIEVVRRIAGAARPSQTPSGKASESSPPPNGLVATAPRRAPSFHAVTTVAAPVEPRPGVDRTDRGIVVGSGSVLASRRPLVAVLAVAAVGAVVVVTTWGIQLARRTPSVPMVTAAPAVTAMPAPTGVPAVTALPAVSGAASSGPMALEPTASPVASMTAPPGIPPNVAALTARGTRPQRSYGQAPRASAAAVAPSGAPVVQPPPVTTKPHGHVDTDSRQ